MANTRPATHDAYFGMPQDQLETYSQEIDREIALLRVEKKAISVALDRLIHTNNAQRRWANMSEPERIAMKQVVRES